MSGFDWDEEAQRFVTRPSCSVSSSQPSLASSSSTMTLSSGSLSSDVTSTPGSWDENNWPKKISALDRQPPLLEFNATFAGQTSHEKKSWLDPNNVNSMWTSKKRSNLTQNTEELLSWENIEEREFGCDRARSLSPAGKPSPADFSLALRPDMDVTVET